MIENFKKRQKAYLESIKGLIIEKTQWEQERYKGIGGSEIASVLGCNKYQSAYQLWQVKTCKVEPFAGNNLTLWGHKLEDVVAQTYAELTGEKIRICHKHFSHKEYPFLLGNIDRLIVKNQNHGTKILECKTCTDDTGTDGDGDKSWGKGNVYHPVTKKILTEDDCVPMNYLLQVQHYMLVTGYECADLAVLFMRTRDFRIYTIHKNEDIQEAIKVNGTIFWKCVLNNVEPDLTETDRLEIVNQMHPNDGDMLEADSDIEKLILSYKGAKEKEKEIKKEVESLGNQIKLFIQDKKGITLNGKTVATYSEPTERITIDLNYLKEDDPNLYENLFVKYKKVTQVSRILRVK